MSASLEKLDGHQVAATPASDVSVALKNMFKLGLSLLATWALALIVRFQLPRHLGPERFGNYNFCDSFAAAFFAFIGFGVETYVQKEVPVRPRHLTDFFAGVAVSRAVVALMLITGMLVTLRLTHRPSEYYSVVIVFALTQFIMAMSGTLSAALQAVTKVGALATVNVVSKIVWACSLVIAIWLDWPLYVFALASLASELIRAIVIWQVARTHAHLRWDLRFKETWKVFVSSLPFYVNGIAISLGGRLDVSMLEFQAPNAEVGWYSAANNLSSLALLLLPLLFSVLMPLLSRARHRSDEAFNQILRRTLEGLLVVSIPITLAISLGATLWIRVAFGASFLPAANSLRVLAPVFVVTYVAMILAIAHIMLDRAWRLTTISIIGICVQPIISIVLVPYTLRIGVGYAGCGAALSVIGHEFLVSILLYIGVGARAFDRHCLVAVAKSLLIAGGVIVLDRLLLGLGPARIVIDGVAYVVAALATRTVRISDIRRVIALARKKDVSVSSA